MTSISYDNYFLTAGRIGCRPVNGSRKCSSEDTFRTRMTDSKADFCGTYVGKDITWAEMTKSIPARYAVKEDGLLSAHHGVSKCGYHLYHAAESTEERPVVVARGVDENGIYFEEKIDVKQIDPYNTSTLELEALQHFMPGEYKTMSVPYNCMQGQEKGLRERFNYAAGAQSLIRSWNSLGYAGQAAQWNEELSFLLGYTENTAGPEEVLFEGISEEYKRNMELYAGAVKERLAASMAKKCSEAVSDMFWGK